MCSCRACRNLLFRKARDEEIRREQMQYWPDGDEWEDDLLDEDEEEEGDG